MIEALLKKSKSLYQAERIGSADSYKSTAQSLQRFVNSLDNKSQKELLGIIPSPNSTHAKNHQNLKLHFRHLTANFLETYEKWMLVYGKAPKSLHKSASGASLTTVGIYLRQLRAIVNEAINEGIVAASAYPFKRAKYVIPAGQNTKKALSREDIEKLKSYQPIDSFEQRSHDLWLFSYYSNGINMTDICHLTWKNMLTDKFSFIRKKTERSNKTNQIQVTVYLNEKTKAIIERWGNKIKHEDNYVFPFLSSEMNADRKKKTIQQLIKVTNKWMNRIATSLNIEGDLTTYAARHTFATILLKSKTPVAFISKQLGHTNLKTTENYLGSFDDVESQEFLNNL